MARERRPDRERRLAASVDPTKNLGAARFFHGHLNQEHAKGFGAREEPLRYYLSACINAGSGAVEALNEKIGRDASQDEKWRAQQNPDDLALFDRLRDIRIEDFHYGVLDAQAEGRWVNAALIPGVTVFSPPGVFVEEKNPSGEIVRGAALARVSTLYIEHEGKRLDVTEACHKFILLVENLISSTSS